MAHCVGHSDFFKNNKTFEKTRPDTCVSRMRNAKKRIQEYIENPNIGLKKVEKFLDALHSIRFQTERNRLKRLSRKEIKEKHIRRVNSSEDLIEKESFDFSRKVLEPDYDLLSFLLEYGSHFSSWEQDLISIVKEESSYFIPQIQTKIMNEGWASFWHFRILNTLDLPQEFHLPFLKSHNQVVRPHISQINPYHLGFYLFNKLEKEKGLEECFFAREVYNDVSAIRNYLDIDDFRELNLFTYSSKKDYISIDDVSDESGWLKIREDLIRNIGTNSMPRIFVSDISNNGELIVQHEHDGRDLDLEYAEEVVNQINYLWPKGVKFFTIIEEEPFEI